ncbi:MAG: IS200/IS605 family transposase [Desulfobacterales bacterium]|nr:IS200/IS605 family transposase [Desulfobacterales bacterium]
MQYAKYRSNNNVVFNCRYHVVFCPKRRKKVLIGNIAIRLKEIIEKICDEINVILLAIEVMPDHIHLALSVDPQFLSAT